MAEFIINPEATVRLLHIGEEREPLLLIDNVLAHPEEAVALAAEGVQYGPAGAAYPGLRAALPAAYNLRLHAALEGFIEQVFGISREQQMVLTSSFSMVTEPANRLKHNQRVPHVDQHGEHNLALVHYLCDASFGGTAFFRHRSTGFQSVREDRKQHYAQTLNREMNSQLLPTRFPDATHPLFEQVGHVEAAFNRLVLYRACILHSPAIAPDAHFSSDPRQGRLTITAFLNPPEGAPPPPDRRL